MALLYLSISLLSRFMHPIKIFSFEGRERDKKKEEKKKGERNKNERIKDSRKSFATVLVMTDKKKREKEKASRRGHKRGLI